jgi:hypothetical protein
VSLVGEKLVIGFTARVTLNRLLEAGAITPQQVQRFQKAAVAFLERAVEYAIKKLPMKEPLIKHAMFLDVQQRAECGVEDAFYFVKLGYQVKYILSIVPNPNTSYLNMLCK